MAYVWKRINYQLPEGNPGRKFKGRGVLLGNQVKNQHWDAAFFSDLGNSPASFEASRWADFYSCLPGHSVKLTDAIQAYIQAKLKGPLCWVDYPPMLGLLRSSTGSIDVLCSDLTKLSMVIQVQARGGSNIATKKCRKSVLGPSEKSGQPYFSMMSLSYCW